MAARTAASDTGTVAFTWLEIMTSIGSRPAIPGGVGTAGIASSDLFGREAGRAA